MLNEQFFKARNMDILGVVSSQFRYFIALIFFNTCIGIIIILLKNAFYYVPKKKEKKNMTTKKLYTSDTH